MGVLRIEDLQLNDWYKLNGKYVYVHAIGVRSTPKIVLKVFNFIKVFE